MGAISSNNRNKMNLLSVVSYDGGRDWNIGIRVREDGDVVVTLFQSNSTHLTD